MTTEEGAAQEAHAAALEAEVARLRAGLAESRIPHYYDPAYASNDCATLDKSGTCDCGADWHNARIDALLRGAG